MRTVLPLLSFSQSQILYDEARKMISRGRIDVAIEQLEEALQISPDNAGYLSHYGWCIAMHRDDLPTAVRLCERAVRMDPNDPMNRVNLGKVYEMSGERADAHNEFLAGWKSDRAHPAPAAQLSRMGIRRPPVLTFFERSHWLNIRLGRLRLKLERARKQLA